MDILAQLQAVDQATLTPLVRQALDSEFAVVIDWEVAPFGGGASQSVYRFAGSALDQDTIIPWSLVLKGASAPSPQDDPSAWQYKKREVLAYQSGLLADLPGGLAAPRCFGIVEQPGGDSWLWLEEITNAATGRWPRERFTAVAHQLGIFSAAWLTGRSLPAYQWLSQSWFRSKVADAASDIAELPTLVDHPLLRPALSADTVARVLRLWNEREAYFTALDGLPHVFCHLDAFPRNLFVPNPGDGTGHIVAIDWEFAGVSALGAELAPLVGGSLLFQEVDPARANALEQAVFSSYLQGLRDAGWRGDHHLVRLGYTVALVLHYVFLMLGAVQWGTHHEGYRQWMEQQTGLPYAKVLEGNALFFAFLLARADEAKQILGSQYVSLRVSEGHWPKP